MIREGKLVDNQLNLVRRRIPFGTFTISSANLQKIFDGLKDAVEEQCELDLAKWVKNENQSDEDFEANKKAAREEAYRVTVSVDRFDNSSTHGRDREILEVSDLLSPISFVYMTNVTAYKAMANTDPINSFELSLDFGVPPLLDANSFVSSPTQNHSRFEIRGTREGWLAGLEKVVTKRIQRKSGLRSLLHGPFVYDYGLFFLGVPFALYLGWSASAFIQQKLGALHPVLGAAAYIYVFMLGLWLYRLLFAYTKWAFPMAELSDQKTRPRKHRKWWWGLVVAVFLKVFWDIVGPYLSIRSYF